MSELIVPIDKGRKTSGSPQARPQGFLDSCINLIYLPDDDQQLHKIPGRSALGSLPGSDPKGMVFLRFNNGENKLCVLDGTSLYETDAGTSFGSWSMVEDQQSPAQAFARSGSFLKGIEDALGRNIVWTGASGELPLSRDEEGNWMELGMAKPKAPTLTALATAATKIFPDGAKTPLSTSEGTPSAGFTDTAYAYDDNIRSSAYAELQAAGIIASEFYFASAAETDDLKVIVRLGGSGVNLYGDDVGFPPSLYNRPDRQTTLEESADVIAVIQICKNNTSNYSENPDGSITDTRTWTTVHSISLPWGMQNYQIDVKNADLASGDQDEIGVRVIMHYRSGTALMRCHIAEIWAQDADAGSTDVVDGGNYQYVITEVYSITLASGRIISKESPPSDTVEITLNGTTHTGVLVTLPDRVNLTARGIRVSSTTKHLLGFNIYRSTKTGRWPNLGRLESVNTDADNDETQTYIDTFTIPGYQLASPTLKVVWWGDGAFSLCEAPPAFHDACDYLGCIACIPVDDRGSIAWSAQGMPDYWPYPQRISFVTKRRNHKFEGLTAIGDTLIAWTRQSTMRFRNLPFIGQPNFDLLEFDRDSISSSVGLAAGPLGYCHFDSDRGSPVVAWISDTGIYMTDGQLLRERGMGIVRLTVHQLWQREVDTSRLDEACLSFDDYLQVIIFDFYNRAGTKQTWFLHTDSANWVQSGQDFYVPKVTGPHTLTASQRAVGEHDGTIYHWSLDIDNLTAYVERTGTLNGTAKILSQYETPWIYATGFRKRWTAKAAALLHTDWGRAEVADFEAWVRSDQSGNTQTRLDRGISLAGDRVSEIGSIHLSGQAAKIFVRHEGLTTSVGTPVRAFGPLVLEADGMDEVRSD